MWKNSIKIALLFAFEIKFGCLSYIPNDLKLVAVNNYCIKNSFRFSRHRDVCNEEPEKRE